MILHFKELGDLAKEKTVYTAGSFDLFHRGHLEYLKAIKNKFPTHKLVVGILPDKRIAAKKGLNRPIIKQGDRLVVMDSIKYIDYAFICPTYENGEDATFIILEKLRPEYVVFPQKKYLKLQNRFKEYNSTIVIRSRSKAGSGSPSSTTQIIKKIRSFK